ncbi:cupin domain-containing protein [Nocardiopsis suaedae]|uniref:Cupin domain-containing protein n=1 Tax=Nocardiopsis suaedae TaxID=3018444 RepID=A0ABT4TF70_9ACTN|nr:cupin domain-containing protein [Nocardiopsis suaedae]MDA2802939.1 cupin domain-containing protein [Nocardiopsis suaedae]
MSTENTRPVRSGEPVDLQDSLSRIDRTWDPRIALRVNDYDVRLAKVKGDFVWHSHEDTDEFFLVIEGELRIGLREGGTEREVVLATGQAFTVPRGVEHRPVSPGGASILMFELSGTVNVGDHDGPLPDGIAATSGRTFNE